MTSKFTIDELMIRVMPGGFFIAIIFFCYTKNHQVSISGDLDFLYTFLFFCLSFIVGEILQTIAHLLEWIIDAFFKRRRPSQIFLYKKNPVLKNGDERDRIINFLDLSNDQKHIFDKEYADISFWKKNKKYDALSQSLFRRLYTNVVDNERMKISNRNYLFSRVIMTEFLILGILSLFLCNLFLIVVSVGAFSLFLWRSRGIARGLVFEVVLLSLKK